jgi:hypothetical protein
VDAAFFAPQVNSHSITSFSLALEGLYLGCYLKISVSASLAFDLLSIANFQRISAFIKKHDQGPPFLSEYETISVLSLHE